MGSGSRRERERPVVGGPTGRTPSAYLRPGYPLAGCSPAEPASVSPGAEVIPLGTGERQTNRRLRVRKTCAGVAKNGSFFVQRMGSTSIIRHRYWGNRSFVE